MRNLKRVLALVLALTMVLSFAISASAGAFTDVQDDDDYASAINLLASLEVLKGFEDGTYNSAGSYTREQFAKILYVLVNGKDDNAAMYQGTAPFPDVAADRWSAGYITWAVNLGICNGRDDGNFWPTDIVKYAEACKMFLIAMGYSSTMYTYPYGFIDKAQTLKMFDDVKGYSTFGEANRGTVAQMAYNALFAEAPRFGTYTAKEGDATTTETKLLIMGAFGVTYEYSILKGTSTNAYDTGVFDEGQVALAFYEKGEENNTEVFYGLNGVFNYDGDVDDLIGVTVKVWHKADENELNNIKVYMIEDSNRDKVYTVNPMDVDTDRTTGSEVGDKVKDTKYTLYFKEDGVSRKLTVYKNGTAIKYDGTTENFPGFTKADKVDNTVKAKTYKAVDLGNNGVVDYLYVSFPQFGKVTSLTSSKISVTALSGDALLAGAKDLLDDDDNVIITVAEGVAKDDYALVYAKNAVVGGASEKVYDVVKAETVSEVKYNRESGTDRYFGGTAYKVMGTVDGDIKLGGTYTLYLNANGYVGYADEIDSGAVGSWILVTDAYNSWNANDEVSSASLVGYLADGTKKTLYLDIDEFDDDAITNWGLTGIYDETDGWNGVPTNKVFTYTTDDDGYVDSLKVLVVNGDETKVSDQLVTSVFGGNKVSEYNPDKTQLTVVDPDGENLKSFVTSKTVIYNVYDGASKIAVLKDTDMPEYDKDDNYSVTELGIKDGEAAVVVIDSGADQLTASNDKYALVISADKYAADTADKYYYVLTVATGGEIVELTTKDVEGASDLNAAFDSENGFSKNPKMIGYFKLVVNSSGKVTDMINFSPENMEDESNVYTLTQGVVTSIPNSKGFEMAGGITYGTKTENGVKNKTVVSATGDKTVVLYADTVGFYTIDSVPVADVTTVANDEDVSAATQASLIKSSVENLAATTKDDLLYVVDVICNDDDEVVETFIFTTPVEGGGTAE